MVKVTRILTLSISHPPVSERERDMERGREGEREKGRKGEREKGRKVER